MLEVHVIPHTHWDREWYHPLGRFRQRLVALIDELLASPARRGECFLLDGQAIVLEDYLHVRPERRDAVATRLRAGSLEAGPWYVLADELIPSGEGLVRNLLLGRHVLRELGASAPEVLYSPDAFGHPAALPTVAAGFGLPLIVLWRGLGGELWPAGDTFLWRAPDRSEAIVHHLPAAGYEYGSALPLDDQLMRERWRRVRDELEPRARLGLALLLNGADHHARQPGLDEALAALDRVAAPSRVCRSSLRKFAARAVERAREVDLPLIEGELRASYGYTWTLQGTFAARAHQKREARLAERLLLREAEPWSALATRAGAGSRQHLLRAAWRSLLECHPHDTLCGCSTDEVARAMSARLEDAVAQARGICEDALQDIVGHDVVAARSARPAWQPVLLLRNATARPRGGVADAEVTLFRQDIPVGPGSGSPSRAHHPPPDFVLEDGRVPYQVVSRSVRHDRVESPVHYPDDDLVDATRVVAWVAPIPGYGTQAIPIGRPSRDSTDHDPQTHPRVTAGDASLANDSLRIQVEEDGAVELATASGHRLRPLISFEDVGDAGDLYTHSPIEPVLRRAVFLGAECVLRGPLRGEIAVRWRLDVPARSGRTGRSVEQVPIVCRVSLVLDAGSPWLWVNVRGENVARDHRLRVVFATGIARPQVFADAAFAVVERHPVQVTPAAAVVERPPPTAPLARYVTSADAGRGVTLFGDGLAEYEVTESGDIAVTLVRAVGELSRNDMPERPGHAGWPVPTPEAQCLRTFGGTFAVLPHGPRDEATIDLVERTADDVLLPLSGSTLRSALCVPAPTSGVSLDGVGLSFSTCKESEDGEWVVLRCANLLGRPVRGRWRFGVDITRAQLARLDETPLAELVIQDGAVEFDAPPNGVVTILAR